MRKILYSCPYSYFVIFYFFREINGGIFKKKYLCTTNTFRQISRQANCKNHEDKLSSRDSIILIKLSGNN